MAIFTTNQARQLYVANHALVRGTSASYTKPTKGKIVIFDGETVPAPFYLLSANAKGRGISQRPYRAGESSFPLCYFCIEDG